MRERRVGQDTVAEVEDEWPGGEALDREVDDVLAKLGQGPLIFNLGHGILPATPIGHVERMLKRVRG